MNKKLCKLLLALVLVTSVFLIYAEQWHALPPLLMVIFPLISEIRYADDEEKIS